MTTALKKEMKPNPSSAIKVNGKGAYIHRAVSSLWGLDGWSAMGYSPCKNGKIWIVTDCKRDVWDLVKWDRDEWTSERGIEMHMTHCKPLSIGGQHQDSRGEPKTTDTTNPSTEPELSEQVCYARPSTRGGLAVNIRNGIESEVVTSNVETTRMLIDGWLNMGGRYDVRPSENEGWSVFFPI